MDEREEFVRYVSDHYYGRSAAELDAAVTPEVRRRARWGDKDSQDAVIARDFGAAVYRDRDAEGQPRTEQARYQVSTCLSALCGSEAALAELRRAPWLPGGDRLDAQEYLFSVDALVCFPLRREAAAPKGEVMETRSLDDVAADYYSRPKTEKGAPARVAVPAERKVTIHDLIRTAYPDQMPEGAGLIGTANRGGGQ
jgi:hypothetical protein